MSNPKYDKIIDDKTAWRNAYSTADGRDVLIATLVDLRLFDGEIKYNDIEGQLKRNEAIKLLGRLGAVNSVETIEAIVNAVLELPLYEPVNERED